MRNYCFFIFCSLIMPLALNAQKKFQNGFYVDLNSDTVRGFVAVRSHYSEAFGFRQSLHSETQMLMANEVRYFGLEDGSEFQSVAVKTPTGVIHEFARSIVVGPIDLLSGAQNYLFVDEKDIAYPIVGSRNHTAAEAQANYQKNAGTFNILFFGCDAVNERAKRIEIGEDALKELLREHAECKQIKIKELTRARGRVFFGPFVGFGTVNLRYKQPRYMTETDFPTNKLPIYGVTLLVHPNYRSPMAIQLEFGLSGKKDYETTHLRDEFIGASHFVQRTDMKVDLGIGFGRIGMRLTGRSNSINPFIAFGLEGVSGGGGTATYDLTINNQTENGKKEEIKSTGGGGGLWMGVGFKKDLGQHMQLSFDTTVSYGTGVFVVLPRLSLLFGG